MRGWRGVWVGGDGGRGWEEGMDLRFCKRLLFREGDGDGEDMIEVR